MGFFMSLGIRGDNLEAEGWSDEEADKDDEEEVGGDQGANERTSLVPK